MHHRIKYYRYFIFVQRYVHTNKYWWIKHKPNIVRVVKKEIIMSSYINQYSKITTKPGANLKNTLISPYSNNADIMLQNNIVKDNDDDNKRNNIQLFSLLGELNGPCISLYDNNG